MGERIQIVYDGEAVQAGTMDVRELAPALLAVGDLFQNSGKLLNGEDAQVSVRVRSDFRRGSFEISLDVLHSLFEQAKLLFQSDDYKTAKQLIELLFGSGIVGGGLFGLAKLLRGRKATSATPLPNGSVNIEINNTHIEIHGDVARLYNNSDVREAMYGVVRPLENKGIDTLEIKQEQKTLVSVRKEEVQYFAPPPFSDIIHEDERVGAFEVVVLSFVDKYRWRLSDGNATFTAAMLDEKFFDRVQRREIAFGKGDILKVRLATKTFQTEKGLKTDHSVIEVLEVIPASRQVPLLPLPREEEES